MKGHEYHVSVKHLRDAQGQPSTHTEAIEFKAISHDDFFVNLAHLRKANLLDEESLKQLVVGMKLFGEVIMHNRDVPLFKEFFSDFVKFVHALKATIPTEEK